MKINCLGSGSNGNAWVINHNKKILLLECGMPISTYQRSGLIDNWNNVFGCCITHSHKDHSLSRQKLEELGIKCYSVEEVKIGKPFMIGTFKILPLPAYHDVDIVSYLIKETETNKTIFFTTDTTMLPNIADKYYDLWIIETNYDEKTVEDKKANDTLINENYKNHLSLEKAVEYLDRFENKPKHYVIAHTSNSGNLDKTMAINKLKKKVKYLYLATNKLEITI